MAQGMIYIEILFIIFISFVYCTRDFNKMVERDRDGPRIIYYFLLCARGMPIILKTRAEKSDCGFHGHGCKVSQKQKSKTNGRNIMNYRPVVSLVTLSGLHSLRTQSPDLKLARLTEYDHVKRIIEIRQDPDRKYRRL